MRGLIRGLHDLWCAVTNRCHVTTPADDPYIRWMRRQELDSIAARRDRKQRHQNFMEQDFLDRLNERGGRNA